MMVNLKKMLDSSDLLSPKHMGLRVLHGARLTHRTCINIISSIIIIIISSSMASATLASQNGCEPNPCDPRLLCVAQGAKFTCLCPIAPFNRNCTDSRLWLDCGSARVTFLVSADLLAAWFPLSVARGPPRIPRGATSGVEGGPRLAHTGCGARREDMGGASFVGFRYNASYGCGTEIRDNGTHLWYVNKVAAGEGDAADGGASIHFACPYPRSSAAQATYPILVPASNTSSITLGNTTVRLQVSRENATLSVRLVLSGRSGYNNTSSSSSSTSSSPLLLLARDCWLGSHNISQANVYVIRHGCVSGPSVRLAEPNGRGPTVELRVGADELLRATGGGRPPQTLFCLVRVCRTVGAHGACEADCPNSKDPGITVRREGTDDGILVSPPVTEQDGSFSGNSDSKVRDPTGIPKETEQSPRAGIPDSDPTGMPGLRSTFPATRDQRKVEIPQPTSNPVGSSEGADKRRKTEIPNVTTTLPPVTTGIPMGMTERQVSTYHSMSDHQEPIGIPQLSPNPVGISEGSDEHRTVEIPTLTPPIPQVPMGISENPIFTSHSTSDRWEKMGIPPKLTPLPLVTTEIPMGISESPKSTYNGTPDHWENIGILSKLSPIPQVITEVPMGISDGPTASSGVPEHHKDELGIPDLTPNPPGISPETDERQGGIRIPEFSTPIPAGILKEIAERQDEVAIADSNPVRIPEGRGKRQNSQLSDLQEGSDIPDPGPNPTGISDEADPLPVDDDDERPFGIPERDRNPVGMSEEPGRSWEVEGGDDETGIPTEGGGDAGVAAETDGSRSESPDPEGTVAWSEGTEDSRSAGGDGSALGADNGSGMGNELVPDQSETGSIPAQSAKETGSGFESRLRASIGNAGPQQREGPGFVVPGCEPPCPDPQRCEGGPHGPRCVCPHGLRKPLCEEADLRVQCGPDHVRVSLPVAYLARHRLTPAGVSLGVGGPACRGVLERGGSTLTFYMELGGAGGGCGSRVEQSASHVTVWNELRGEDASSVASSAAIDRTYFTLRFNCSYRADTLVHLPFPVTPTLTVVDFSGGRRGAFRVAMSLHRSDAFSAADAYTSRPALGSGQRLFVRIALSIVAGRRIHLVVDDDDDDEVVEVVEEYGRLGVFRGRPPGGDAGEVATPAEEEVATPAEEGEVATPAEGEVATPAEEEVATPAEEEVATPAEEEVATPAEEEVATPAEEEVATPAEEEVATRPGDYPEALSTTASGDGGDDDDDGGGEGDSGQQPEHTSPVQDAARELAEPPRPSPAPRRDGDADDDGDSSDSSRGNTGGDLGRRRRWKRVEEVVTGEQEAEVVENGGEVVKVLVLVDVEEAKGADDTVFENEVKVDRGVAKLEVEVDGGLAEEVPDKSLEVVEKVENVEVVVEEEVVDKGEVVATQEPETVEAVKVVGEVLEEELEAVKEEVVTEEVVDGEEGDRPGGWRFRVAARGCWATPTPDMADNVSHVFIERGCPSDGTLRFRSSNGNSSVVLFELVVFRFVPPTLALLYLHCRVRVCAAPSAGCSQTCESPGRGARSAGDYEGVVTFGPIARRPPSLTVLIHQPRRRVATELWFSLLGVALFGLVAATAAVLKWRGILSEPGARRQRQEPAC